MNDMYRTYEEASQAVNEAMLDIVGDMGEEVAEAAYGDVVNSVASMCPPPVAEELIRRKL